MLTTWPLSALPNRDSRTRDPNTQITNPGVLGGADGTRTLTFSSLGQRAQRDDRFVGLTLVCGPVAVSAAMPTKVASASSSLRPCLTTGVGALGARWAPGATTSVRRHVRRMHQASGSS